MTDLIVTWVLWLATQGSSLVSVLHQNHYYWLSQTALVLPHLAQYKNGGSANINDVLIEGKSRY